MNYKTFLKNEIHRFVKEHNRVPTARDMGRSERGEYPSVKAYQNHFGSWSQALIECGYKPNRGKNPSVYRTIPKYLQRHPVKGINYNGYIAPTKLEVEG